MRRDYDALLSKYSTLMSSLNQPSKIVVTSVRKNIQRYTKCKVEHVIAAAKVRCGHRVCASACQCEAAKAVYVKVLCVGALSECMDG